MPCSGFSPAGKKPVVSPFERFLRPPLETGDMAVTPTLSLDRPPTDCPREAIA
jgi:hypothetical protein